MAKTFLYLNPPPEDAALPSDHGDRDKVRILVVGRPPAVNRVIVEMSHLGFSDPVEWSKPIATDRDREAMRVLTRYVFGTA